MGVERLEHHWRTTPLDCVALLGVGCLSGNPPPLDCVALLGVGRPVTHWRPTPLAQVSR